MGKVSKALFAPLLAGLGLACTLSAPLAACTGAPAGLSIASWSIQLQDLALEPLRDSPADLLVIDYSRDGLASGRLSAAEVAGLRCRPDGRRRLVVGYLSIGEAESYRYYWQRSWNRAPPAWLGAENRNWPGNFRTRYWAPEWQAILFGSAESYLDTIIAAGFDGVFLDGVDSFAYWRDSQAAAPDEMADLVIRLAAYARRQHACFLVLPLNPGALLTEQRFRTAISGVVVEDLFYGEGRDGKPNRQDSIATALGHLAPAQAEHLPILALEYLRSGERRAALAADAARLGLLPTFGARLLQHPSDPVAATAPLPPFRARCAG